MLNVFNEKEFNEKFEAALNSHSVCTDFEQIKEDLWEKHGVVMFIKKAQINIGYSYEGRKNTMYSRNFLPVWSIKKNDFSMEKLNTVSVSRSTNLPSKSL